MSAPILLLTRRLMVGAFSRGSVVVPDIPTFFIAGAFNDAVVSASGISTTSFAIGRVGGIGQTVSVTWVVVPAATNPLTSAYLTDASVLIGKSVTFGPTDTAVTVTLSFAAVAPPSVDLGASVVLTAASAGAVIDPGNAGFLFVVDQAVVGPAGNYDLGAGGGGYLTRWTPQLGSGAGIVVTQQANGIVVDCASATNDQTAGAVGAMFWAQTPLPTGAWRATFGLTQLDPNVATTSNGIFFQLIPGFNGGRGGADANPNNWTTAQYRDPTVLFQANSGVLDKYGSGLRASFDQDALNPSNSDQLRVHQIKNDGSEGNIGGAQYGASFVFDPNVAYTVAVEWKPVAGTFTWTKTSSAGGVEQVVISDPEVATWIGSYLGFNVSDARQVLVTGFDVVHITETVVSSAREDDPAQWATILPFASVPAGSKVALTSLGQLANTTGGKVYVLSSDISGTTVTIDGVGSKAAPIEVRGDVEAATGKRKISATKLLIQNASHVYFRDIDLGSTQVEYQGTTDHISFERCQTYGRTGGIDNASFFLDLGAGADDPIRYLRVRYHQHGKTGVTTQSGLFRCRGARKTNFLFPNHPRYIYLYKNRYTNITEGSTFNCIISFCGDNDRDWYRDLQLTIYDSLIDGCNCQIITELKPQGCWVSRVTYERGTGGWPAYMRNRHSANQYIGNLFVTRSGSSAQSGRGGITIRDKGCLVINNHSYTLADGTQPSLSSPPGAAGDRIGLFTGTLDATLYPTNEGDGNTGSLWPDALGTKCGGNNMPIIVGDAGGGNIPAVNCVVPPAGGGRVDRNRSVTITSDSDFAGRGKYRLAATGSPVYVGPPAYGTLTGGHTTITDVSLVPDGADITQVPHRWLQAEVGPGAGP